MKKTSAIYIKRQALLSVIQQENVESPILLPFPKEELKELFFDYNDENLKDYYILTKDLKKIFDKIDFSNIPFDNVEIAGIDFSKMHGVRINPQTIHNKNLSNTTCKGVKFINPNNVDIFKDVIITETNFTGSIGAKINPQTINKKSLLWSILNGVEFIGPFDNVFICFADFTGSKNAIIDPNKLSKTTLFKKTNDKRHDICGLYGTILCDAILTEIPKRDIQIYKANFTGSNIDELVNEFKQKIKTAIYAKKKPQY